MERGVLIELMLALSKDRKKISPIVGRIVKSGENQKVSPQKIKTREVRINRKCVLKMQVSQRQPHM